MTSLEDIVLQNLVERGNKNRKIIFNRLKLSLRFSHFFHQNGFSLRVLKSIFHWEIFFNSRIIKTDNYKIRLLDIRSQIQDQF